MQNNNDQQPRLIAEPESEYTLIPEEQARKEEYREHLRQYLQNPEFRQIPGFPIGDDEAILELSDPPYYTACPNPFLTEIIEQWQKERVEIRKELGLPDDSEDSANSYHREPFASDVSEGKNNPIYNAHSYHTKVPHPALMRYILHYTDPGDIVFDGFCGTGMTGVAAQLCGNRSEVEKLGYFVNEKGLIFEKSGDDKPISFLGHRNAILNDLSPAATFISYNYNKPVDMIAFKVAAHKILDYIDTEYSWMHETLHTGWSTKENDPKKWVNAPKSIGSTKGKLEYVIWSDVFICPQCGNELVLWEVAVDAASGKFYDEFSCPECGTSVVERRLERAWETFFDPPLDKITRRAKQKPVLINYSIGNRRFEKNPDATDIALIKRIENYESQYWFPVNELPDGDNTGQPKGSHGAEHVHQYFTARNNFMLSNFWGQATNDNIFSEIQKKLLFCATASMLKLSRRIIFSPARLGGGTVATVALYFPSLSWEKNPLQFLRRKVNAVDKAIRQSSFSDTSKTIISTQSSQSFTISASSIDYIFIDPPFGGNLMYSELNFLWEAWLRVLTNNTLEAIVNKHQRKSLPDYQKLMESCLREFYRILKPGRWITIEFHNSSNKVWNAIQEAALRAGFVVADVRVLDKKQSSFKQETSVSIAKKDLIISGYKPHAGFEQRFIKQAGSTDGCWEFIRHHLGKLPVVVKVNGELETNAERQAYLLFDRMVAFHIQRGATVPLSASNFYAGLEERFPKRDGMYFLPEQVPDYDHARLEAKSVAQLTMFVSDEKTAIQWLRQQFDPELGGESHTYQDIQPKFLRQLHQAKHEVLPELSDLLEQNFLQDEQGQWYVPNPNKASDLEKIRNKSLQQEFNQYLESKKKLKQFRTEAVRAGFADAWQRKDFETIVKVAERLPETVLQEDPDLLMYYDNASLRVD